MPSIALGGGLVCAHAAPTPPAAASLTGAGERLGRGSRRVGAVRIVGGPLPRRSPAPLRLAAGADGSGEFEDVGGLAELHLFPLPSVLVPSSAGFCQAIEPQFKLMFNSILKDPELREPVYFGHILTPRVASPAILEGGKGGLPLVGTAAEVMEWKYTDEANIAMRYEARKRFRIVSMKQTRPWDIATVEFFADTKTEEGEEQAATDQLEQLMWSALQEIARLTKVARPGEGGGLPKELIALSPPPPADPAEKITAHPLYSGVNYQHQISTWRRANGLQPKVRPSDPYQAAKEAMGKHARQEAFSFCAVNMVDAGVVERTALLRSQSTRSRLEWLLSAIQPYVESLRVEASVMGALAEGGEA